MPENTNYKFPDDLLSGKLYIKCSNSLQKDKLILWLNKIGAPVASTVLDNAYRHKNNMMWPCVKFDEDQGYITGCFSGSSSNSNAVPYSDIEYIIEAPDDFGEFETSGEIDLLWQKGE